MYRPPNWDSSWKRDKLDSWQWHRDIYEAGADAMLEGLMKSPYKCHRHILEAWYEGHGCCTRVKNGVLVFIPIEEHKMELTDYGKTVFIPEKDDQMAKSRAIIRKYAK